MQIRLKNFKQYKDRTFTFPAKGLVRLKGISGSGKTTILHAIRYGLTGEAKKIKSWLGGSPRVEIEFDEIGLKLIRTSAPETLQVFSDRGETRDAQAQAEIYRLLGDISTDEEFQCSSYVGQRMKGALLMLGPTDMLRLVQKLAFGNDDPDVAKKEILSELNDLNKSIAIEQRSLETMKRDIEEKRAKIAAIQIVEPTPPAIDNPDNVRAQAQELKTRQAQLIEESRALSRELSLNTYQDQQTCQIGIALCEKGITENTQKLQETEAELQSLGPRPEGPDSAFETILAQKIQYLDRLEEAKNMLASAKQTFPDFQSGPLSVYLENKKQELEVRGAQLSSELLDNMSAVQDAHIQKQAQPCPVCSAPLRVVSGQLHHHDGTYDPEVEKSALACMEYTRNELHLNDNLKAIVVALAGKASYLKSKMGVDPAPHLKTREDVQTHRATNELAAKVQKNYDVRQSTLADRAASYRSAIQQNIATKEKHLKKLEQIGELTPKEQLIGQMSAIEAELSQTKEQLTILDQSILQLDAYTTLMRRVESAKAIRSELTDQLAQMEEKLKSQADLTDKLLVQLGGWKRLKELSDFAAVQAIDKKLDDINSSAEPYIDQMFPDDGTVVRIQNVSKTQEGEERAKLSLSIVHKGHDISGLDADVFSGGERDRIVMGFQLAMSSLYSSPIFMVDEGFVGADVEKTLSDCLQVLKSYSENKLVLVVQHGAPDELFDEVVDLGSLTD